VRAAIRPVIQTGEQAEFVHRYEQIRAAAAP
jgi:hypothetical protein